MATKIQVWAFNEFTAFDSFTQKVIGKTDKAESDYSGKNQVKMINLSRDHGLSLLAVLALIKEFAEVDMLTWSEFHNKIFRQNGEMRKGLKTVKLELHGMFFTFDF